MKSIALVIVAVVLFLTTAPSALAHQPYFEDQDIQPSKPWMVKDPTISTAVYATLESREDVDYFAFDGRKGQRILLSMVVPQIRGQDTFAPEMLLMGPGLPPGKSPPGIVAPSGSGLRSLPALQGKASPFFEPFSRTSYWQRQEERVSLPSDGRYVVAVYHKEGAAGRYTFVIGDRERFGGDPAFGRKLRLYWRPVEAKPAPTPTPTPSVR